MKRILALLLGLIMCFSFSSCAVNPENYSLALAAKAMEVKYSDAKEESYENFLNKLDAFAAKLTYEVYADSNKQSNICISPVSVYMALALATECANGETRDMLAVSFASCANIDEYKDNLGSDYKIEIYDNVVDNYAIQKMIFATNTKTSEFVMIVQCRSDRKAKDFSEDVDELYKSFGVFEVEVKGKFVFFGSEDAIKDALGE